MISRIHLTLRVKLIYQKQNENYIVKLCKAMLCHQLSVKVRS